MADRIQIARKTRVVLQAICKDVDGNLFDPTTLQLIYEVPPYASRTTYTYGTNVEITRVSQGKFRCVIYCDFVGNLRGLWRSTGTNQETRTSFDVYVSELPFDT